MGLDAAHHKVLSVLCVTSLRPQLRGFRLLHSHPALHNKQVTPSTMFQIFLCVADLLIGARAVVYDQHLPFFFLQRFATFLQPPPDFCLNPLQISSKP